MKTFPYGTGPKKDIDPSNNPNDFSTGFDILNVEQVLFDADDIAPNYVGINSKTSANQYDLSWKIYKFYYDGSGGTTQILVRYGAW